MKENQVQTNQNVYRKNYNDADSGKVFLICIIAPILLALLFSIIASSLAQSQEVEVEVITSSLAYTIPYTICNFLLYIAIYLVYNKTSKIEFSAIKPKFKMKWHTYLIAIAIGVISLFGIQYFIGAVDNVLEAMGYPLEQGLSIINPTNWGSYFLAIFILAIMPAIGEELMFRGMILQGLRSRFNDVVSVVLSALMFALMHANLQQLVYPFLLGLIMGWIALRTGSIISSIVVHFVNNFLVVTFSFIQNMTGFSLSLAGEWWLYVLAIALLAVTFGICYLIDCFYFKHKSREEREKTSFKTSKFIYISLVVSVFVFLFMTISQITA